MKPSDLQHRFAAAMRRALRAGAIVLLLGAAGGERTWAAPAPATPAAPSALTDSRQGLRDALAARYEALPAHNGVVLKPRTEELGVRTIEVTGDTIAVNGERVTEGVLRAWLGDQAEPILRLHHLAPAERQALFNLKGDASRETPPAAGSETAATSDTAAESPDQAETADTADTAETAETAEAADTADTDKPEAPTAPTVPPAVTGGGASSGSRVKVLGGITVDKDEVAEQAVAVLGSVRVEGQVAQDAVAVGGSVVVNGKVGGNVVAVGGSVHLGKNAEVMGDVTSVGGTVDREEGAKVHGSTQDVGVAGRRDWERDIDIDTGFHLWPFFGGAMSLVWRLISLLVLSLLVFLCLLLGRRQVERAEYHVATETWKAGVVGFLAQLLFLPLLVVVTILLAITIIGCALYLLYPFLFVGVLIAFLVGYTAVAHQLGLLLERRFDRRFGSLYAVALMGVLTIEIWNILGHMVGLGGGFLHLIALLIVAFGVAMKYAAWTVGIGSVILARLNAGSTPAAPLVSSGSGPVDPLSPVPATPGPGYNAPALPLSERWEDAEDERHWEEPPPER